MKAIAKEVKTRVVEICRINLGFTIWEGMDKGLCSDIHLSVAQGQNRQETIVLFNLGGYGGEKFNNIDVESAYAQLGLERPSAEHAIRFCNQRRDLPQRDESITFYLREEDIMSSLENNRCVATLWRDTVYPGQSRRLDKDGLDKACWKGDHLFAGVVKLGTIFEASTLDSRSSQSK